MGPPPSPHAGLSPRPPSQQLENVCWQRDGRLIVSCHSDGSYCQWPASADAPQREPSRSCEPYGQCSTCLAGARPRPVTCDCLSECEVTSSLFPVGLSYIHVVGAQPRSKAQGPEQEGSVQSHTAGFLLPVVAFSGNFSDGTPGRRSPEPAWRGGPAPCRPACLRGKEDVLQLVPFLAGPFPCKAITKIFWLTTRQG